LNDRKEQKWNADNTALYPASSPLPSIPAGWENRF